MVSLTFMFWLFVLLFAIIGATRGWAKEILVTFAVILSLFLITIIEKFAPIVTKTISPAAVTHRLSGCGSSSLLLWYSSDINPRTCPVYQNRRNLYANTCRTHY